MSQNNKRPSAPSTPEQFEEYLTTSGWLYPVLVTAATGAVTGLGEAATGIHGERQQSPQAQDQADADADTRIQPQDRTPPSSPSSPED
ncbi:hypothetical protein [Streptomyces sp. NPDC005438]|uniref:hypothetical protein n=1 Tax=Streptomyces sp. NPDC005438 TaxID=3156880 RepID=UPI0033AA0B4D